MTLDEFMTKKGMSNAALAAELQTDRYQIYRYRKGKRRPRPEMMARIREITAGTVSYGDWYAPAPGPEALGAPAAAPAEGQG